MIGRNRQTPKRPGSVARWAAAKAPAAIVLAVVLIAGLLAVQSEGLTANSINPGSGAAWLLRGGLDRPTVANVNGLTMETSVERLLSREPVSSVLDIHQNGAVALLEQAGDLWPIDVARAELAGQPISLPPSGQVSVRAATMAMWLAAEGKLWIQNLPGLQVGIEPFSTEPVEFVGPIVVEVAPDGDVWSFDLGTSSLSRLRPGQDEPERTTEIDIGDAGLVGLTAGEDRAFVLTATRLFTVEKNGAVAAVDLALPERSLELLTVQEPSVIASLGAGGQAALVAGSSSGLVAISLATGETRTLVDAPRGARDDVRPVVSQGCAYGLADELFLQACIGQGGTAQISDRKMSRPRLRKVRDLVFYEDWIADAVGIWPPGAVKPAEIERPETVEDPEDEACLDPSGCVNGDESGAGRNDAGSDAATAIGDRLDDDGLDDAPIAVDDAVSIIAGRSSVVDLLANDIEPDGDQMGVLLGDLPEGLNVIPLNDRRVAISVEESLTGQLRFTYRASDGRLTSDPATVVIDILSTGSPSPVLEPDQLTSTVGASAEIDVLFNDRDQTGQTLTLVDLVAPNSYRGAVSFHPGGRVSIVPIAGDVGTHLFTYRAGVGNSRERSQLTVTVLDSRTGAPEPASDFVRIEAGSTMTIDLLANDRDPDGDPLGIIGPLRPIEGLGAATVSTPNGGLVRISVLDGLREPTVATFGYTVSDGVNTTEAVLHIAIEPDLGINRPPVAVDDHIIIRAGSTGQLDLLANDVDLDADDVIRLTDQFFMPDDRIVLRRVSPSRVEVTVGASLPSGLHRFDYVIDDYLARSTGTVHVLVPDPDQANRPPVVLDDRSFDIEAGTELMVRVADWPLAIDPDGDALTLETVSLSSATATAAIENDGRQSKIRVDTQPETTGSFAVTYTVADGQGASSTGTFTVVVLAQKNNPPIAVDDRFVVASGVESVLDVLGGDSVGGGLDYDPEGGPLEIHTFDDTRLVGEAKLIADGAAISYRSPQGFEGTARLQYSIRDTRGSVSDVAHVIIRVEPRSELNRPPVAVADDITLSIHAGEAALRVRHNDSDPDPGDTDGLVITEVAAEGDRFQPLANGSGDIVDLSFHPTLADAGQTFSARYRIRDGLGAVSEPATVVVNVLPVSENPSLQTGSIGVQEVVRGQAAAPVDVIALARYDGAQPLRATVVGNRAELVDGRSIVFTGDSPGDSVTVDYVLSAGPLEARGTIRYRIIDRPDGEPVGNPDSGYRVAVGETLAIPVADLLANDRDSSGILGSNGGLLAFAGMDARPGLAVDVAGSTVNIVGRDVGRYRVPYLLRDTVSESTASSSVTIQVVGDIEPLNDVLVDLGTLPPGVDTVVELGRVVTVTSSVAYGTPSPSGPGVTSATLSGSRIQISTSDGGDATIEIPYSDGRSNATVTVTYTVDDTAAPVAPDRRLVVAGGAREASIDLLNRTGGTTVSVSGLVAGGSLDGTTGLFTYLRQDDQPRDEQLTYRVENEAGSASGSLAIVVELSDGTIDAVPRSLTMGPAENDVTANLLPLGGRSVEVVADSEVINGIGITGFGSVDGASGAYSYRRQSAEEGTITFDYLVYNDDNKPGASAKVTLRIEPGGVVDIQPPTNVSCVSSDYFSIDSLNDRYTHNWTWTDNSFGESGYILNTRGFTTYFGPARQVRFGPDQASYSYTTLTEIAETLTRITVINPDGADVVYEVKIHCGVEERNTASLTPIFTPGDGTLEVAWTPLPDSDVDHYEIRVSSTNFNRTFVATSSPVLVTGLANGEQVSILISVCRTDGTCSQSSFGESVYITPPGAPGQPTGLVGVADENIEGRVRLTWTPPAELGDTGIASYEVQWGDIGFLETLVAGGSPFEISDLSPDSALQYRVRACNAQGLCGPFSVSTPHFALSGRTGFAYSSPLNIVVSEITSGSATVSWQPPQVGLDDPAISRYEISVREVLPEEAWQSGTVVRSLEMSGTVLVVTELTDGKVYRFEVSACNDAGCGLSGFSPLALVGERSLVPGPPGDALAKASGESGVLELFWSLPLDNGSSEATRAEVEIADSIAEAPVESHRAAGLLNGREYTFRVRLCNEVGCGPWSAVSEPMAPFAAALPRTPSDLIVEVRSNTVDLAWTSTDYSGAGQVTEYVEFEGFRRESADVHGSRLFFSVPVGTHRFRVQACNVIGCSEWTDWSDPVSIGDPVATTTTSDPETTSTTGDPDTTTTAVGSTTDPGTTSTTGDPDTTTTAAGSTTDPGTTSTTGDPDTTTTAAGSTTEPGTTSTATTTAATDALTTNEAQGSAATSTTQTAEPNGQTVSSAATAKTPVN